MISIPEMFHHYRNVLERLGRDAFELVLLFGPGERELTATLDALGYRYVFVEELLRTGTVYRHLVSEHRFAGRGPVSLQKIIGVINVRFMYALGKSRWNFSAWNRLYDLILCFGPFQVERLGFCTRTLKREIGYPRYDKFFTEQIDREQWLRRFGCDPRKKTVVWLPTWKKLSSVALYAEAVASLLGECNVVVKPHPLSLVHEPDLVAQLEGRGFTAVIRELVDNTYLYAIADVVLCDYGGPPFGAIYTDRNLLLLNLPGAERDENTGADSADLLLRRHIVNLDPERRAELGAIVRDDAGWARQARERAVLRDLFFAPHRGDASRAAAEVLGSLDALFRARFPRRLAEVFAVRCWYRALRWTDGLRRALP